MRLIGVFLFVVVSVGVQASICRAFPAVGDFVRYKVTIEVDGKVEFDGFESKAIVGYRPATGQYLVQSIQDGTFVNDHYQVTPKSEVWTLASDLLDSASVTDELDQCGSIAFPGRRDSVRVMDREIEVCVQDVRGVQGSASLGLVPFEWVKLEYQGENDGHHYSVSQRLVEVKDGDAHGEI